MGRFVLTAVAAIMAALPGMGQEHWRSGFTVGVSGDFTVDSGKDSFDWQKFWGTTVSGGYKWYAVKGLFVKPEVTLGYENHDFNTPEWDGASDPYPHGRVTHSTEVTLGVAATAGYTIPASWLIRYSIMTGPRYNYGINQHEKTDKDRHNINRYSRSSLRWRFGFGVEIWRISVWGAYDIGLLKEKEIEYDFINAREQNVVSVGLDYKF